METSKKLTWIILSFYALSIIIVGIVKVLWNTELAFLLDYIAPCAIAVVISYFGKAGVENWQKIKVNAPTPIPLPSPTTDAPIVPLAQEDNRGA